MVYAADGQSINMEYIYEFFNNRNCPLLRGKPKFFIVQACRGDRPDQGVDNSEASTAPPSPEKTLSQSKKRRAEALDAIACTPDAADVARARYEARRDVITISMDICFCFLDQLGRT